MTCTAVQEPVTAILRDAAASRWREYRAPVRIIAARHPREIQPALRAVEQAVEGDGLHAAGWLSYEAAPGLDPALTVRPSGDFPLLWFGLFTAPRRIDLPQGGAPPAGEWRSDTPPESYARAFAQIKDHIRSGNTYQVNFTTRLLRELFTPDPWQTFLAMAQAQRASCGAYLQAGPWRICSASPELFFRLEGTRIESRPMKGTAPRGLWSGQDRARRNELLASAKNRAENLMIVDMVRHDLGRIARPGSVRAEPLCAAEAYPTVWQLTSTVAAETDAGLPEILAALFPPASITGAPKQRTMEIIAELEASPRRIYTGAIGFMEPGRRAQFNVAIRTLLLDTRSGRAEYGTGGGIVWDSDLEAEQAECRTKARILTMPSRPPFELLETLLWTPEDGIRLLELHLARLQESAAYFGFACDGARIRAALECCLGPRPSAPQRLRLRLAENGTPSIEVHPFLPAGPPFFRVALARRPIDRSDVFLYHKTTQRRVYEDARAEHPDHDDVILFNEDGEATETTIANLVAELDGALCTPPVECGLLPGTARAEWLARGALRERVLPVNELQKSPRLFVLNSVRGLVPAGLDW